MKFLPFFTEVKPSQRQQKTRKPYPSTAGEVPQKRQGLHKTR